MDSMVKGQHELVIYREWQETLTVSWIILWTFESV